MALFTSIPRGRWLGIGEHRLKFFGAETPTDDVPVEISVHLPTSLHLGAVVIDFGGGHDCRINGARLYMGRDFRLHIPQGVMFQFGGLEIEIFQFDPDGERLDNGRTRCRIVGPREIKAGVWGSSNAG